MSSTAFHTRLRSGVAVVLCVLLLFGAAGAQPLHALSAHEQARTTPHDGGAAPGLRTTPGCADAEHLGAGCGLCFLAAQSALALCPTLPAAQPAASSDADPAAEIAVNDTRRNGLLAARAPPRNA